jgi:hypothetical protein
MYFFATAPASNVSYISPGSRICVPCWVLTRLPSDEDESPCFATESKDGRNLRPQVTLRACRILQP